jgi:DNA-binding transcriptional LysR family regulator
MRDVHSDNADLNLLRALDALLEERHVSRAADRFHLSQSAMSRTLTRLRETFRDELLVRTGGGYELTPRARAIQDELDELLPRLRSLVRGDDFDPASATDAVRIHGSDYACSVLGPRLFAELFHRAPRLSVTVEPLSAATFDDLGRGRVDLALTPVRPPAPLTWTPLFEEDYVCVLSAGHPLGGEGTERLTLAHLTEFPQVTIVVLAAETMISDRRLRELGVRPRSGLRVPFFSAAVAAVSGTTLIAMVPRRFARQYAQVEGLRIAEAPEEFESFSYGMSWHPRLNSDPAQAWLRSLVQVAAAAV